jgi:hypothetical protein
MRSRLLLTVAGVSAAVMSAVVFGLWVLGSSTAAREPFSTITLVPQDVELYVALNTAPSSPQWMAFSDLLNTMNVEDPLREAWNELLSEQDLRWDEDIVSLLGDEGYLAITDFEALNDWHGVVGAFQLRDRQKAADMFLRLATEAAEDEGEEILEDEYEGVTIYYLEEETYGGGLFGFDEESSFDYDEPVLHDTGAIAFTDDVVVFGLARQDVEGVIDVIQGRAPSAASGNQRLEELRARQGEDFLFWGYVDLSSAWDAMEDLLADSEDEGFDATKLLEEGRANADRLTFSVSAQSDGFVVDVTLLRAPGAPEDSDWAFSVPFDSHYAKQVPEDTLAFVAGYDLYNHAYRPIYDAISQIDINLADPYCSQFSGMLPFPTTDYSESDDPVLGQFYDEDGNFDNEAYSAWNEELEQRFTDAGGDIDYDAYYDYTQSLYEDACEESARTIEEALEEFEQDLGFDLEDDLLGLMTGEFALTVSASNFDADEPDFSVLGLLDVSDPGRASESMQLLGRYLEREHDMTVTEPDASGIQRVSDPESGEAVAWVVTDGTLVIGYPEDSTETFVRGLEDGSLADSDDWVRTMALLPEQKTSVVYVNTARILEEVQGMEDVEEEFADLTDGEVSLDDLKPIRSVAIATSAVEGGWLMRAVVLVQK